MVGRTVVVTGASRGIGRAIAAAFRERGARVIGTRVSEAATKDAVCDEWLAADFADQAQIARCADAVRSLEPDVLVNNAGINRIAPFTEVTRDDFLRIMQVNAYAPLALCQAAVPGMARRGWGRIVNVSSIFGRISKAQRASYSASKFALDGLTVALAAEHTADGILANCIAPGFVDTDLTRRVLTTAQIAELVAGVPARRLATVDEVAQLVVWLGSAQNTFVAGQNVVIDGGFSRV